MSLVTGDAQGGQAGHVTVRAGEGNIGEGGYISLQGGRTTDARAGGYVNIQSGYSTQTSSGPISLGTANAGAEGVSGSIMLLTGTSSCCMTSASSKPSSFSMLATPCDSSALASFAAARLKLACVVPQGSSACKH